MTTTLPAPTLLGAARHAPIAPDHRTFQGLAQVLLDVRLVAGLLALTWAWVDGQPTAVLLALTTWMVAMLVVLLRWRGYADVMMRHPVLHLLDLGVCSWLLAEAGLLSPFVFLLLSGGLFTGLCLGRRGAYFFTPGYVVCWLLTAAVALPAGVAPGVAFLVLVVVPVILVAMLFGGGAFQAAVCAAARLEQSLQREREVAAVAEERARLARELHDSVTKSLYGMAMLADALPTTIRTDPEAAIARAGDLAQAARTATVESRDLLVAMRRADARVSAAELVTQTAERWRASTGRPLGCRVEGSPRLDPAALYELGAILDEALENVARHTPREVSAEVELTTDTGWLVLRVRDAGPGMAGSEESAATRRGHYGLLGMRERAARIGALLDLESAPGQGTTVSLRVPLGVG